MGRCPIQRNHVILLEIKVPTFLQVCTPIKAASNLAHKYAKFFPLPDLLTMAHAPAWSIITVTIGLIRNTA
jgi:hypothetical protein